MRYALIALLLTVPIQAFGADYQSEIDAFFQLYEQDKRVEAVDRLYSTNKWMESAADAIHNIKIQLEGIEQVVGNYNGKVLVDELTVKDRFVHVTYLALYDRQPVRMEFQFYKPKDDWMIYSFAFDIEFDDEIEAGARARIASGK